MQRLIAVPSLALQLGGSLKYFGDSLSGCDKKYAENNAAPLDELVAGLPIRSRAEGEVSPTVLQRALTVPRLRV